MSTVEIKLASNREKRPVAWAETGEVGLYGGDPQRPIMGFTVEVNTLEDLARIANAADEKLIVGFNPDGAVESILIYDDYIE